jgi:hypothetical protein
MEKEDVLISDLKVVNSPFKKRGGRERSSLTGYFKMQQARK